MTIPTIITIDQARAHLRLAADSPVALDLSLKIQQATEIVIAVIVEHIARQHYSDDADATTALAVIEAWTPMTFDAYGSVTRPSPDTTAPAEVIAATLYILGQLDRFRGDDEDPPNDEGRLPAMARAYLWRYLTPVLA